MLENTQAQRLVGKDHAAEAEVPWKSFKVMDRVLDDPVKSHSLTEIAAQIKFSDGRPAFDFMGNIFDNQLRYYLFPPR